MKTMKEKKPYFTIRQSLLVSAMITSIPAASGYSSEQQHLNADAINITATRTVKTADETLASVTVITKEDINRLQVRNVQELLRGVTGIGITNNGGAGKATSLFMRGTESDHILVIIDGIKIGSATSGAIPLQHIPLDLIERIEIVRGPRSGLYGSEAIGGVIQIFTGGNKGVYGSTFSISAGSHNTGKISAAIAGGDDQGWYNIHLGGENSNGFNSCSGSLTAGCYTIEPDDDGYKNISGSMNFGYRLNNGIEIGGIFLQADNNTEFDGSFQNKSEDRTRLFGGHIKASPTEALAVTFNAGRSIDQSNNFLNGTFASKFNTTRDTFSLQNDLAINEDQLITLGFDYQQEEIESTTLYPVSSRENKGVFSQYLGSFHKHDLQLNLRRDDNEQFGGKTTGSIAWGYGFDSGIRVTTSYGTAFKAPTFNELYFPFYGNPNILPESSNSFDIGLSGDSGRFYWSANLFRTEIDDLIAYDAALFTANNINKALIHGLEFSLTTSIVEWQLKSDITLLDPRNKTSGANNNNTLPRRPKRSLRIDIDRDFYQYSLGATLLAESGRYDDLANSRRIDGYGIIDLRGEYEITRSWRLQARLGNLLDKDYETASFYPQDGRNYMLTLIYQP